MQLSQLDSLWPLIYTLSGSAVVLGIIVVWLVRHGRGADARFLRSTLKKHAEAVEQDVVLSDGVEGFLFADYLVLLPGKIVVVKTVSEKGYVFGAADIDEWTCVENNRTGKFRNPLLEVRAFTHQARHVTGFEAIEAWALFDRSSEFPKGVPDNVLRLATLDEELAKLYGSTEDQVKIRQVWDDLIEMARSDKTRLEKELS